MTGLPSSTKVANETTVPVIGTGTMSITAWVKGRPSTVTLRKVLHAPGLALTLLSIPALTDDGYDITFTS